MSRRFVLVSAVIAGAMLLGGMSGASTTTAQATPSPSMSLGPAIDELLTGYLATNLLEAAFLQWAADGATVTGTLTEAYLVSYGATSVDHRNLPISGTLANGSVTLNVGDALSGSARWSGVLTPDGVVMGIPSSTGSIDTTTFVAASVADYNAAVSSLAELAAASQRLADIEAQQAALRSAVDSASERVKTDIGQLDDLSARLRGDLMTLTDDQHRIRDDGQTTRDDVVVVINGAKRHPDGYFGQVCADAATVSADASSVDADKDSFDIDLESLKDTLRQLETADVTLRTDATALADAQLAAPEYAVADAPTATDVDRALSARTLLVGHVRERVATLTTRAEQWVASAHEYARTADRTCDRTG